jgi:paraquat-inducible protein B
MRPEKLNKYRNGNFELNSKHIFAQKNLENIRNYLLISNNLLGGSNVPQPVKDDISNHNELYEKSDFEALENQIKTGMAGLPELLVKQDDPVFNELMNADKQLIDEFNKYRDLASQNYDGLEKKEEVKKELLKIQKSLFNLQVKIIFSKLRKIKNADITPLLNVINVKIETMNKYIEEQERKFDESSSAQTSNQSQSTSNLGQSTSNQSQPASNINQPTSDITQSTSNITQPIINQSQSTGKILTKDEFINKINDLTVKGEIDGNKFDNKSDVDSILSKHKDLKDFLEFHKVPLDNSLFKSTGDFASAEFNEVIERI